MNASLWHRQVMSGIWHVRDSGGRASGMSLMQVSALACRWLEMLTTLSAPKCHTIIWISDRVPRGWSETHRVAYMG